MTSELKVMELFTEANPMPDLEEIVFDPDGAPDYLATITTRDPRPVVEEVTTRRGGKRRTILVATAGLAAVAAAIIIGLNLSGGTPESGPEEPATPTTLVEPPTTVPSNMTVPALTDAEVATGWVRCFIESECEGVASSTPELEGDLSGSSQELVAFMTGLETSISSVECSGTSEVTCTIEGGDLVRSSFGYRFSETWGLRVVDKTVVAITSIDHEDADTLDAFQLWIEANYPDESLLTGSDRAASWAGHATEFRGSDDWVAPFAPDVVGEWLMLKGETWTFSEEGIYTVADHESVYETGNYDFDGTNITLVATESPSCLGDVGVYELRFVRPDRFSWHVVEDECGIRGQLLNGLGDRQ